MPQTNTEPVVAATCDAQAFEAVYTQANGDAARIPWADEHAHPGLVTWLNRVAPSIVRSGARVAVVGCGLGQDARELLQRGFDVSAFDVSPTAIAWAKRLDTHNAACYVEADLFALPGRFEHRFDLVVESNTVQALQIERRAETLTAIARLLAVHGRLLMLCRGCEETAAGQPGPPWPLTPAELREAANTAGLEPDGDITVYVDNETPPVRRIRTLLRRM